MVSGVTELPCKVRQGLLDTGALGEDVLSLVFHQHLHALHISAPKLQPVLHPLDLKANQEHMGISCKEVCARAEPLVLFWGNAKGNRTEVGGV